MNANRYSLRALALLLGYPDQGLREHLPALMDAIDAEAAIAAPRRKELRAFAADLARIDIYDIESRYVETFDRGRNTSLHMFEHVHGDSRDRGPALIDLGQTYQKSGLMLGAEELPDHLCVVLESASTQPPQVAQDFLAEMAHVLTTIFSALLKRGSPYATVLAAVLELAGQKAQAVAFEAEEPMDEAWAEPEAFDGCSTRGQARPGDPQPLHFVRRATAQQGAVT